MNPHNRIRNLVFRLEWNKEDADTDLMKIWMDKITSEAIKRRDIINDSSHPHYTKEWFGNIVKVHRNNYLKDLTLENEDTGGFHIWEPDHIYNRNMSGAVEFVIDIINDIKKRLGIPVNFTVKIIAEIPNHHPRWVSTEPLKPW